MRGKDDQKGRSVFGVGGWGRHSEIAGPPASLDGYGALAVALLVGGDRRAAVVTLRAGLAYRCQLLDGPTKEGLALQALGRWDEATCAFRLAESHIRQVRDLYLLLGRTLRAEGDVGGAVEAFREAWTLDPGNPELRAVLGELVPRERETPAAAGHRRATGGRQARAVSGEPEGWTCYSD